MKKIVKLDLTSIDDFKNHPFLVEEDAEKSLIAMSENEKEVRNKYPQLVLKRVPKK